MGIETCSDPPVRDRSGSRGWQRPHPGYLMRLSRWWEEKGRAEICVSCGTVDGRTSTGELPVPSRRDGGAPRPCFVSSVMFGSTIDRSDSAAIGGRPRRRRFSVARWQRLTAPAKRRPTAVIRESSRHPPAAPTRSRRGKLQQFARWFDGGSSATLGDIVPWRRRDRGFIP